MKLTPEALRALEEFHATPVAAVLANRPPRWEPWEAVSARYREAFAALDREQAALLSVCRLPPEERGAASRRARPC